MAAKVRLDRAGIAKLLKSAQFAEMVHTVADDIRSEAQAQNPDVDIVVDTYVTDRAAASVTIRDPRGRLLVARDGALIRHAAGNGIEVTKR